MSYTKLLGGTLFEEDQGQWLDPVIDKPPQIRPSREIRATIKLYLEGDDVVREYDIRGVTGELRQWEPSYEDRQQITTNVIASLLVGHDIDVHEFKEIIELAMLKARDQKRPQTVEKLDRIHYKLGGME